MGSLTRKLRFCASEVVPLRKCCFCVPLPIGIQVFGYVSILYCLVTLCSLVDLPIHLKLNCSEIGNNDCTLWGVDIVSRTLLLAVNILMLYSVYRSRHYNFILLWVCYTLVFSVFAGDLAHSLVSDDYDIVFEVPEVLHTLILSSPFVWNVYGCLVGCGCYRLLTAKADRK